VKVYLAAAWGRREEILAVAERLRAVGVEVTSGWLIEEKGMQTGSHEKFLREHAYVDLQDLDAADAVVRFADDYVKTKSRRSISPSLASGARHFEFGYAKAKGKTLYVVGGKQNVFDRLDGIVHVKNVSELIRLLGQED
jgi:nucleoside 2-deoxyribosyltransferase